MPRLVYTDSGKVALYVSDSADFAVNAQTPEPKEAYMTPAGVASSNGKRDKRVQLKLFPGSQLPFPFPQPPEKLRCKWYVRISQGIIKREVPMTVGASRNR